MPGWGACAETPATQQLGCGVHSNSQVSIWPIPLLGGAACWESFHAGNSFRPAQPGCAGVLLCAVQSAACPAAHAWPCGMLQMHGMQASRWLGWGLLSRHGKQASCWLCWGGGQASHGDQQQPVICTVAEKKCLCTCQSCTCSYGVSFLQCRAEGKWLTPRLDACVSLGYILTCAALV